MVDLVVKDQQELVGSGVVHRCNVWVVEQGIIQNLAKNTGFEVFIIFSLEDLVLGKTVLWLDTLVNTV